MRDKIKAVLDAECKANFKGQCPDGPVMAYSKTRIPDAIHYFKPSCWQCHRNNLLSEKIEDAVKETVNG